jgi:thiol-disulfide isomerase/thioredoxin
LIGWILFAAFSAPAIVKTGFEGRILPSFDLLLTDSLTHLNTGDIPTGKPLIVIGFSPWCTHCQEETRDIIKHIDQFRNIRIYYVTSYPFEQMMVFYRYFKLVQYPNIVMGMDTRDYFLPTFKANGTPYTLVFDSTKRLKQVMKGQVDAVKLSKIAVE